MARELGDLVVRLSLDSAKFDEGMKRLEASVTKIQDKFRSSTTGMVDFDKVLVKLQGSATTLTERLSLQKDKVAQLEKAYAESKRTKGADAEETQKLAVKLEDAKKKLDNTETALKNVNAQIEKNKNGFYQLGENLKGAGEKLDAAGKKISGVGKTLSTHVTAPVAGLGAVALKASIDFESAFAGVKKTVDARKHDFDVLAASIKEMSERIPASTTELAGIMEMAGQLGVEGEANLAKFTEAIAALGVSTNLTTQDAAMMLAQFANVTGMDISNIDRLGSVVVALGNRFQTTESHIVNMGQRLSAAGSQLGMSESQIMAFAAALSSVGIEAEAGGTAFSKLMINMKVAAETGAKGKEVIDQTGMSLRELQLLADQDGVAFKELAGSLGLTTGELKNYMSAASDLDNFAKVTGMTAEQFRKAYGEDAAGAMMKFLEGLHRIETEGGSAIVTLDEMGITESRLRNAILSAAESTENFGKAQETANTAWEENIALQKEANERYGTTESRLSMLKNKANNLAAEFGDVMVPTLLKVADALSGVIDWLKGLSDGQKETIVKIAAFVAAVGPVLLVVGKTVSGIGKLTKGIGAISTGFSKLQGVFKTASAGTSLLSKAIGFLTSPIGIVIAAVAALVGIFIHLYNNNEAFREKVQEIWGAIKEFFAGLGPFFANLWEGIRNGVTEAWEAITSWVTGAWEAISGTAESVWGALTGFFAGLWEGISSGVTEAWESVTSWLSDAWNSVCETAESIWGALTGFFSGLWDGIKSTATTAWGNICSGIQSAIDTGKAWITGAWETVKTAVSDTWENLKTTASTVWTNICSNVRSAVETGKAWITNAWGTVKTAVSGTWDNLKTTATTAWNSVCTNARTAIDSAKTGIQNAWSTITTSISNGWNTFKTTASTTWTTITDGVKNAISNAKSGIVSAWDNIKSGVKSTWDKVESILKSPIDTVSTWLTEKVDWFKGLFNFQWKLPEFKLPKISVTWKEIGWGIKLPTLSVSWNALGAIFKRPAIFPTSAGLQGVGEAGPEAVLPLNRLWDEMSVRLKSGMLDILRGANLTDNGNVGDTVRQAVRDELSQLLGRQNAPDSGAKGETALYLQVDGKTFARLILPYMDKEQAALWGRNLRLAGV